MTGGDQWFDSYDIHNRRLTGIAHIHAVTHTHTYMGTYIYTHILFYNYSILIYSILFYSNLI